MLFSIDYRVMFYGKGGGNRDVFIHQKKKHIHTNIHSPTHTKTHTIYQKKNTETNLID